MDDLTFDALAMQFAQRFSRRRIGVLIAALGLGGSFGAVSETEAKKKKRKKKKKKTPAPPSLAPLLAPAAPPCTRDCAGKACGESDGCDGRCNNGSCPGTTFCVDGTCQDSCPHTICNGNCINTNSSNQHCGGCDQGCDPGETCASGQCQTSGCAAGQRDCGGGLCIPDDDEHCCNLADCGGQFSALFCNATTHRCECETAGWGRCTGQDRFNCGPCCPGSALEIGERCAGLNDELICVDRTLHGCRCPDALPNMCTAFNRTKCTFDQNRDPRVCGQSCQACGGGGHCCGGNCYAGCAQGTGGTCATAPCNDDCSSCEQDFICCNFGNGPVCTPGGTTCFPP